MLCIRYDALMSWPFDKMQWHLALSIVRALPLCNTKWPEEWYSETMWASCTLTTLPQWCSTLLMILAQISYHSGSQKCWFSYFTHSFCMLAGVPLWSVHKQLPLFSSLLSITTHSWIFFFSVLSSVTIGFPYDGTQRERCSFELGPVPPSPDPIIWRRPSLLSGTTMQGHLELSPP